MTFALPINKELFFTVNVLDKVFSFLLFPERCLRTARATNFIHFYQSETETNAQVHLVIVYFFFLELIDKLFQVVKVENSSFV